jgi:hypothetical protein
VIESSLCRIIWPIRASPAGNLPRRAGALLTLPKKSYEMGLLYMIRGCVIAAVKVVRVGEGNVKRVSCHHGLARPQVAD